MIIYCIIFLLYCIAAGLEKKVKELYKTVVALEEEKYDWETKIRKQVCADWLI